MHILAKHKVWSHAGSAVNDARVISCSADFDQQKGFRGMQPRAQFWATLNCLIWHNVELAGLQNRYLVILEFSKIYVFKTGMRSRDIFGRLRLQLRLRGSIPAPAPALAPAPAPSKTVWRLRLRLRLRAKCTGSGGSGSGSGSDDQVLIWALTSNTIFKNAKCQNMTSYWLGREFECFFEEVSLKFVTRCHPRPLADIGEVTDSFGLRCLRLVA